MKKVIVILSALFLMSCGGAGLDQSKPENVLEIMFEAAKTGDFSHMAGLCHDDVDMDGDVKDVCSCGESDAEEKLLDSYKEYFAKGKVTATRIDGDKAEVDFSFGPDGSKKETMKLVKIEEKWYLSSF